MGAWLQVRARKSPEKVAVIFEDEQTTYLQLWDTARQIAVALEQRGLSKGDRVAYLGENHPLFLETMFACFAMGIIFVPLNTRLASPEISYQLIDSGSSLLIASTTFAELATTSSTAAGIEAPLADDLVAVQPEPLTISPDIVDANDPALILYTSGTTGLPKGALLTHQNLTANAFNVLIDYDLSSDTRALMVSPLFHVASLGMGALPTILKGGTIVLERRFDPERSLAIIEKHAVTWMSGVPTTFQLLTESPTWPTTNLGSLRQLTCGGSPIPAAVVAAYESRGLSFTGGYGMTEASPGVTSSTPGDTQRHPGSCGQPHFFVDIRIAEPDDDGIGEIQIRGLNVIRSYWNNHGSEAFLPDGWFRTGDIGRIDDGYLYVSDRLKDMVISGGENIYSAEVELVIAEHEAIAGVAVIGQPDDRWGEIPIAIVTARTGFTVTSQLISQHLEGRIARYKIPKQVIVVAELPRTASGKVQKALLRTQYAIPKADRNTQ